jgi:hypothetical protein
LVSGAGWAIVWLSATSATRGSTPKAQAIKKDLIVEIPQLIALTSALSAENATIESSKIEAFSARRR